MTKDICPKEWPNPMRLITGPGHAHKCKIELVNGRHSGNHVCECGAELEKRKK